MNNLHKHNSSRYSMTPMAWRYRTTLRPAAFTRVAAAFVIDPVAPNQPHQVQVNALVKRGYRKRRLLDS